jgi:hypothetical protein
MQSIGSVDSIMRNACSLARTPAAIEAPPEDSFTGSSSGDSSGYRANDMSSQGHSFDGQEHSFERMSQKGPWDCREAILLREELKKLVSTINWQATAVKNAAEHYRDGSYSPSRSLDMTMKGTSEATVEMVLAKKDGSLFETTIYNRDNPDDLLYTRKDSTGTRTIQRRGSTIQVKESSGECRSFSVEEGMLVKRTPCGRSILEEKTGPDGSFEIREFSTLEGERHLISTRKIDGDKDMKVWNTFVLENSSILKDDGSTSSLSDEQIATVVAGLSRYPVVVAEAFKQEGLSIILANPLKSPPGGYKGSWGWPLDATGKAPAAGYYSGSSKAIIIAHYLLSKDTITHEAGHAFDDIQSPDSERLWGLLGKKVNTRSQGDGRLKELFNECRKRSKDHAAEWSSYALCNIEEYYAEGFRFHLGSDTQRETLKNLDPNLDAFLSENLGSFSSRHPS